MSEKGKSNLFWSVFWGEQLAKLALNWAERGNGSLQWGYNTVLEPPFEEFDLDKVRVFEASKNNNPDIAKFKLIEKEHCADSCSGGSWWDWKAMQIIPSPSMPVTPEASHRFLLSLSEVSRLSFEIYARNGSINLQIASLHEEADFVADQIRAHFPQVTVKSEVDNLFTALFLRAVESEESEDGYEKTLVADLSLSWPFAFPLKTWKVSQADIWPGIVAVLSELKKGEVGVFQTIFTRTVHPWAKYLIRWAEMNELEDWPVQEKISQPLYATVLRVAAQADSQVRCREIIGNLVSALNPLDNPRGNKLVFSKNVDYQHDQQCFDILTRDTLRSGMLLNSQELVSLVHLPPADVQSSQLPRSYPKKTKQPPAIVINNKGLFLGYNEHQDKTTAVLLNPEQRVQHTYIIGGSGTGKTNLLHLLILQDIMANNGLAVLDPHGDLIDALLEEIPEKRREDVILFDPSDEKYPIGFNVLTAHSELEKNLLASDLVAVFRRLSASWGDQMNSVLANTISAFLESSRGGTLADLRPFFLDTTFRDSFLKTVQDPGIVYYWQKEFPRLVGSKSIGPLLTRLDTFLRPKIIRNIVCQKETRFDFAKIMDEGKIFLAKLSQGAIGEENAYLLGSLLISKFHQLTLARQAVAESERRNFYLYIDEFHNFLTPSMSAILAGARKYRLGLIMAHQELRQLSARDPEMASSILANAYVRVCFRVGDADATKLADGFSYFDASDLKKLSVGEAICRVERSDYDFNLWFPEVDIKKESLEAARRSAETIRDLSRKKYCQFQEQIKTPEPKPAPPEKPILEKGSPVITPPPALLPPDKKQMEETLAKLFKAKDSKPEPPEELGDKRSQEHQRLQHYIKNIGEDKGYKATIEKPIPDGRIDVVLEKEGKPAIACEISVTTTPEHEIGNIEKCLSAGYGQIALISNEKEKRTLRKIEESASKKLKPEELAKVAFFTPEEFYAYLGQISTESVSDQKTRGWNRKTVSKPQSEEENEKKIQECKVACIQGLINTQKKEKDEKKPPEDTTPQDQ